jgi:hypothetical protein
MKIHVYAPCWNDAAMIPFFLRHYSAIADRIFVFDDGSTDGSLALLRSCPKVEVRSFEHRTDAHCFDSRDLWEHAWKEHRAEADWVIACNLDEHADHADLRKYLRRCARAGVSVIPSPGYEMVADRFPTVSGRLCDHFRTGAPARNLTKTMIFRPADIVTMHYMPGRHDARPEGRVCAPARPEVRILHYKYLGFEFVLQRHAALAARLRPGDRERRFGWHYSRTADELRAYMAKMAAEAMDVDADDIRARLIAFGHTLPAEPTGWRRYAARWGWTVDARSPDPAPGRDSVP